MFLLPVHISSKTVQVFTSAISAHKLPSTEVHITSLPNSDGTFNNLVHHTLEAIATRGIIRAVRQAALEHFDAFAIGCFYDTALSPSREISADMVVTAPCIAACEIAASLGNRFGIIVGREKWVHHMRDNVFRYGYRDMLTGFYPIDLGVHEFLDDVEETERRMLQAGKRAVEIDHAEVIILGCTLQIGFYRKLGKELGVPVIEATVAALKRAEYAAILKRQCGWVPSRVWSCEPPREEELEAFRVFEDREVFDQRVVVGAGVVGGEKGDGGGGGGVG